MSPRIKAYVILTLVSLIWGVASAVIKFTLRGIDPLPFLTYRFFIASIFALLAFLFAVKHVKTLLENFKDTLIYGVTSTTLALGLLFLGLERTTVLDATLIGAVAPMVTAIAGVVLLKERVTRQEKLGIAVAFSGTVVTVLDPVISKGFSFNNQQLIGNLFVVGYLLVNSISAVWAKKLNRKKVDAFTLSNSSFIIGFLAFLPMAAVNLGLGNLYQEAVSLPIQYQLGVFYMALVSGTLAYALWIRGQRTIEISEAGVFMYLIPIFAAPLGVFWLGEKVTAPFVLGAVLIAIGVAIAEYKKRSKSSR